MHTEPPESDKKRGPGPTITHQATPAKHEESRASGDATDTIASERSNSQESEQDETKEMRISRLWAEDERLSFMDAEEERVQICTELLDLIDQDSISPDICSVLRHRAVCLKYLKNYDAALVDLARELNIAQEQEDQLRVNECNKLIDETNGLKREAEIQAEGGEKSTQLQALKDYGEKLWAKGTSFEEAFDYVFERMVSKDRDLAAEALRLLVDSPYARERIFSIYEEFVDANPRRASLAGRVLGRKIAGDSENILRAEIPQIAYGLSASFIPCVCAHCGELNKAIAAPPRGALEAYYGLDHKSAQNPVGEVDT